MRPSRLLLVMLGVLALGLHATHLPLLIADHEREAALAATARHDDGPAGQARVHPVGVACCGQERPLQADAGSHASVAGSHVALCAEGVTVGRAPRFDHAVAPSGIAFRALSEPTHGYSQACIAEPPGLSASRLRALLQVFRI
jgi:hypothetical protein